MRPTQIAKIIESEFLHISHGLHTPVMIWGAPGVGKSQIVAQVADQHQATLIDIRLSQMEPSDLRGIPFREKDKVEWAVPSLLPEETRHGTSGVLFLDEINAAPPSVSAAAYQLILDRRLGEYRVPDNWIIIAAGNRQGDRGISYTMPAPLANRFSHFELEVNLDDWVLWAWHHGIDERVIGFLRFRPELLFAFDPAHNPLAFPSPRSWEFAHRALQKFSNNTPMLRESLQSCVGASAGIEMFAYIENLSKLPDLDKIISGEEHKVPHEIDLQYAVASALVGRAIKVQNTPSAPQIFNTILQYAQNFKQREMGVMLVADMHRAIGSELFKVDEFANWAQHIGDVMLYE